VEWLKELGFDNAFNYKKVTVRKVGIQVLLVQTIIKRFKAIFRKNSCFCLLLEDVYSGCVFVNFVGATRKKNV
jgi:hypothetical protein